MFSYCSSSLIHESGGESWHKGGSEHNQPEHLTVMFKKDDQHVTTKHIYKN